jgi:hypothetical protein
MVLDNPGDEKITCIGDNVNKKFDEINQLIDSSMEQEKEDISHIKEDTHTILTLMDDSVIAMETIGKYNEDM